MRIVPKNNGNTDLTPIQVKIQNRADLMAVILRTLRYFFQCGFQGLRWHDDPEKSTIFIQDSFMENPDVENPRPSVILSMGGAVTHHSSIGNNLSSYELDRVTKYSEQTTSFNLEIVGRNKLETYKLVDGIGTLLFLMDSEIKKYTPDMESLYNVQMSEVRPLNQTGGRGDAVTLFTGRVDFTVDYTLNFKMAPLAPLFTIALFETKSFDKDLKDQHEDDGVPIGNMVMTREDGDIG